MEIRLTFQERLKDLRTERRMTLSDLETATGISRSSLGKYESDDCKEVSHASSGHDQTEERREEEGEKGIKAERGLQILSNHVIILNKKKYDRQRIIIHMKNGVHHE